MPKAVPKSDFVPLANAVDFCQAVLDDIEGLMRQQFGPKWSPEAARMFFDLRRTVVRAAEAADGTEVHAAIRPLQHIVTITNYPDGR